MKARNRKFFLGVLVAAYFFSMTLPGAVFATPQQVGTPQFPPAQQGLKRGINPETGKVSFIGGGDPVNVPGVSAGTGVAPQTRAMGVISVYGAEFGLTNPVQELKFLRARKDSRGNDVVHYQQVYRGVPILAGEMIVNLNSGGQLLSVSGEVSSGLLLDIAPAIPAREAEQTALTEIAKLHQMGAAQLSASVAELWIFDESLLTASTRPVELVWRLEVTANDAPQPIRELVLVNAQTGGISFHANQVDTGAAPRATKATILDSQQAIPSSARYADLVVDETRGQLYGADLPGNKVDVIDMADLSIVSSLPLAPGAAPTGIDLRPDGNELAVTQSGLDRIAFVNLASGAVSETPVGGPGTLLTDVVYGRPGILYALSDRGLHVIDVSTVPHVEDATQFVGPSSNRFYDARFGAISSDRNTLYYVTGSDTSGDNSLNKYDVSSGLAKPTLLAQTLVYRTGYMFLGLSLIDDSSLLLSPGTVYNTSNLTPKARNGQGISPIVTFPGKNFYAVGKDLAKGSDELYFYDNQSSYQVSTLTIGIDGIPGAMAVTSDGNTLFVSSTGGMTRFTIGATPPGTPLALPQSRKQYRDLVFDMPRNVIYSTDPSNRIDVIDQNTGNVVNSYLLPNGANPVGIDLSPEGSELAVALNGLEKILFLNPETGTNIAEVTPQLDLDGPSYTNLPFDVIYGRPGRLYSEGNPGGYGNDYLHVIDTTTHTWVAKSTYPETVRSEAEFVLTSDQNYLYINQPAIPNNVYVFDVRTDTVAKLYQGPHGPVIAAKIAIVPDGSKVFTSEGQVWSGNMQTRLGDLQGGPGTLIDYVPGRNAVALATGIAIKFIDANNYSLLSTYFLPNGKTVTEMEVAPDGSKLILNYSDGVNFILNLTTFPPPTPIVTNTPTPRPTLTPRPSSTPTLSPTPGPGPSRTPGATSTAGPSPTAVPPSSTGSRRTYSASGSWTYPGTFLCDQSAASCTNGTDADADHAHQYAADTFVFYNTHHGRNSFDNQGGSITSTVHFGVGYQNAFWDGYQMVYGDGMAADDVVGHEITHGVTQYASNLIYSYQSGAINESLSDVWGEFIDQTNGSGNDADSLKWLIAEDSSLGAIRSMSNPTLFGDPDKMSSPYYYHGSADNGGVHFNSGVNNKAAFLMTQGGAFNGRSITGIGLDKTAAVYYEAQANLLTAGSNYNDLYYALVQACQNLLGGPSGITQSDCSQVKTAAEAVEMVILPPTTPTPTSTPPYSYNPLYLSLTGSQTIGGVSSADEDILRFDGTNWSLYFDGSDVGTGSPDLFAFSLLDADTILMSFGSDVTVNGIAATPQDILRFDASSLGGTTAGVFSLYFDGSDVGLDSSTSEKIDSLSLLPDGRLLISTNGNPSVPGLAGKDEDVFAFSPASLGDVTSGSWSMYFDGSDVGLSETTGEDVDALDVVGDHIYLSTQDVFSVSGLSGADEDVFVCAAKSVGDVTACDYLPSLYFDGSTWGLDANDVDAFHFLAATPAPTAVPSTTIIAPPTNTSTGTATSTATSSPAATPTYTATSTGGGTFTFIALADAYVNAGSPTGNYGSSTALRADASPDLHSYLRFEVQGLSGTVSQATLRVYANSSSSLGCSANAVSDNTWSESTINYNNAPAVGSVLGSSGLFGANVWVDIDVSGYITGNGTYNLALTTTSSTALSLASREAGANAPQLIVETTP